MRTMVPHPFAKLHKLLNTTSRQGFLLGSSRGIAVLARRSSKRERASAARFPFQTPFQSAPWQHSVRCSTRSCSVQAAIDALAGEWGDDKGLTIHVEDSTVRFSDATGSFMLDDNDGFVTLRGGRLVGTASAPQWCFPDGEVRHWARPTAAGAGNFIFAKAFFYFKEHRLQLRRNLHEAVAVQNFDRVTELKAEWASSHVFLTEGLSTDDRASLARGRNFVSGACFKHKRLGCSGVILGFDAWCTYPTAWRARWVPNRPQGEAQPFYHCLVDVGDGESWYVAEEDLDFSDFVYPLHLKAVDEFFVRCDPIGGYLPGPKLDQILELQRSSGTISEPQGGSSSS